MRQKLIMLVWVAQEEGGTYYLISRALGPRIGGAVGCMYYLGVALLAVLETLGAIEMLLFTFPSLHITAATRILSAILLVTLGILVRHGLSYAGRMQQSQSSRLRLIP